jgi:hypothetical protein
MCVVEVGVPTIGLVGVAVVISDVATSLFRERSQGSLARMVYQLNRPW